MAIGPHQLNRAFLEEAGIFEDKIDSQLANMTVNSSSTLTVLAPPAMTISHFQILKERYKLAGWEDVTWNDDPREGTWISFKRPFDKTYQPTGSKR